MPVLDQTVLLWISILPRERENCNKATTWYVRSAVPGDEVAIHVRLVGAGKTASAWNLEIQRGDETLLKDRITAFWVNETGKPMKW